MKIAKVYKDKVNDFINYLIKQGNNPERINKIMQNTIITKYNANNLKDVKFMYNDIEITQKIHRSFKDYHGFCYNVVIHEGENIKNIKNILGINSKNKRKEGILTIIHELLHLLSQNEEEIDGNLKIKSGICEIEYMQNKLARCNGSEKLNEGMTEYLARKIKAKLYGEFNCVESVYVYEDLVPIINNFLFEDNHVENLLKLYMNNDRKKLYKLIKEKTGISEYRITHLWLPLAYTESLENIIEYRFFKITKKIIKFYLKTHTKEELKKVCENILKDFPNGKYKRLENLLNQYKGI